MNEQLTIRRGVNHWFGTIEIASYDQDFTSGIQVETLESLEGPYIFHDVLHSLPCTCPKKRLRKSANLSSAVAKSFLLPIALGKYLVLLKKSADLPRISNGELNGKPDKSDWDTP